MGLLGAHMPTRGNPAAALEAGAALGCQVVQLFVKSPMQWTAPPLSDAAVLAFREAHRRTALSCLVAHAAYLINLAAPDPEALRRSRLALLDEWHRCQLLQVPLLVVHAGAHLGSGEAKGVQRLRDSLNWLLDRTDGAVFPVTLLVENTAGQGTCIGYALEHLAAALDGLPVARVGVCLDTCHLFAAGRDFRTPDGVNALAQDIAAFVGWQRVRLIHANDARRPLGSRVDRHEHIGDGHIGAKGFQHLLTHPKFATVPVVIETPNAFHMHAHNLQRLRSLLVTPQS